MNKGFGIVNLQRCGRIAAIALLVAVLHAGCSTIISVPAGYTEERQPLISIALPVARFVPGVDTVFAVEGKSAGAASGAGQGALECLNLLDPHDSHGLSVLATLICMPVAAIIGGTTGAARAEALNKVLLSREKLRAGLDALRLQQALADRSAVYLDAIGIITLPLPDDLGPSGPEELPDYATVSGTDAVLELSILDIVAGGSGNVGLPLSLGVTVRARLVPLHGERLTDQVRVFSRTPERPLASWLANDQALLANDLDHAIRDTATRAVDELLLLWHPPGPVPERRPVPAYALEPVVPPARTGFDPRGAFFDAYRGGYGGTLFTQVDSAIPTLQWERFPRSWDANEQERAAFSDVRYELRIYDAVAEGVVYAAGRLIYERSGLPEPSHQPEITLTGCGRYFWTVRARFSLHGAPRVTEWSGAYVTLAGSVYPWVARRGERAPWYEKGFVERQLYLPFRVVRQGATCAD